MLCFETFKECIYYVLILRGVVVVLVVVPAVFCRYATGC